MVYQNVNNAQNSIFFFFFCNILIIDDTILIYQWPQKTISII